MKTALGKEVDLLTGHVVLDGIPAPAKGAQQRPSFSAHVYCGPATVAFYQLVLSRYSSILHASLRYVSSKHTKNFKLRST